MSIVSSNSSFIGDSVASGFLDSDGCLLNRCLAFPQLSESCRQRLLSLREAGFSLRRHPLTMISTRANDWFGQRLYLFHRRLLGQPLSTVVCSHLGRSHQHLPEWPRLLESALQHIQQCQHRLLLAEGTSLTHALREYAQRASIAQLELKIANENLTLEDWLQEIDHTLAESSQQDYLFVSPSLNSHRGGCQPLRDALCIGLADRAYALWLRFQGKLAKLVQRRLQDPGIADGSTIVFQTASRESSYWLDRGAVGWYSWPANSCTGLPPACQPLAELPAVWQPCSGLPSGLFDSQFEQKQWFAHCTRGSLQDHPHESATSMVYRHWASGQVQPNSPFFTLEKICREGLLRGSNSTQRGAQPRVSFSAIPLPQLLKARVYRSHLGRWDWEPYGVLIRSSALRHLGLRPVIYGQPSEYRAISPDLQPYFQARGSTYDWTAEEEWRILGDVNLHALNPQDVRLFTKTKREALQLAQRFSWTVFWVES